MDLDNHGDSPVEEDVGSTLGNYHDGSDVVLAFRVMARLCDGQYTEAQVWNPRARFTNKLKVKSIIMSLNFSSSSFHWLNLSPSSFLFSLTGGDRASVKGATRRELETPNHLLRHKKDNCTHLVKRLVEAGLIKVLQTVQKRTCVVFLILFIQMSVCKVCGVIEIFSYSLTLKRYRRNVSHLLGYYTQQILTYGDTLRF